MLIVRTAEEGEVRVDVADMVADAPIGKVFPTVIVPSLKAFLDHDTSPLGWRLSKIKHIIRTLYFTRHN